MRKAIIPTLTLILLSVVYLIATTLTSSKVFNEFQVGFNSFTPEIQKEVRCLAQNMYYESAYEPDKGKIGVAFVTLNRTKHPEFPSSICGVVTQKTNATCQFSWYCQDKEKSMFLTGDPKHLDVYKQILQLASFVYANREKIDDPTNGAIYYHADYVNPKWKNVNYSTTIGRHIFYTEKRKSA